MKYIRKNALALFAGLGLMLLSLTGCYETHYYNHYHHHSRGWYDRHNEPPPPNVNFEMDIHN